VSLGRIRGIRIGLDHSWFLILFLVIWWLSSSYREILGVGDDSLEPYLLAVASALLFFGSILLHELGHALVALRRGIPMSGIDLWMFGGVARMERDSDSAATEFKIAVAGPLVTLAIAVVLGGTGLALAGPREFGEAMRVSEQAEVSGPLAMLAWLTSINAIVLVFNLLPAFPLDGGRITRAIAWWLTGDRNKATFFATGLGRIFGYLFIAIGLLLLVNGAVLSGIWLGVIGLILMQASTTAASQARLSRKMGERTVADLMDTDPVAIRSDLDVERALDEYFRRYGWPWFPVVDADGRFLGPLRRKDADSVPFAARETTPVSEVIDEVWRERVAVAANTPLESLLANVWIGALGSLAALDPEGRLVGTISLRRLGETMRETMRSRREQESKDSGGNS